MEPNDQEPQESNIMNKRQRFLNLMKTTKDVYIPNLKSTLSQQTFKVVNERTNSDSNNLAITWPPDLDLLYYPTYSTFDPSNPSKVNSTIRLNVFAPGNLTGRRNRIIVSLCKQYLKTNNDSVNNQQSLHEQNIEYGTGSPMENSVSSLKDAVKSENSTTTANTELDTFSERISGFLSRTFESVPVRVKLKSFSEHESIENVFQTDSSGNINVKLSTDFIPDEIIISIREDSKDQTTYRYPMDFIEQDGFALISDLDDTIKHTGITGNKRSMFRNVFVHDTRSWTIKGMPLWYDTLRDHLNVDFFYVSNSPVQLFPIANNFIKRDYPWGPLFLKQYSGNFLSSLMTSSANRKLEPIWNIIQDFPKKKFILVGDSGEKDLEASLYKYCYGISRSNHWCLYSLLYQFYERFGNERAR